MRSECAQVVVTPGDGRAVYLPVQIHWLTAAQTWIPRTGTRLILLAGALGFSVGGPSSSFTYIVLDIPM